jgi:hypothetical protein
MALRGMHYQVACDPEICDTAVAAQSSALAVECDRRVRWLSRLISRSERGDTRVEVEAS